MNEVFTPETLAQRWGCSARHVRKLISIGALGCFRLGGKLVRISAGDVEKFECQQNGASLVSKENIASPGTIEEKMEDPSGDVIVLEHKMRERRKPAPRLDTRN
jgi:excisionase family DNA binding protein